MGVWKRPRLSQCDIYPDRQVTIGRVVFIVVTAQFYLNTSHTHIEKLQVVDNERTL